MSGARRMRLAILLGCLVAGLVATGREARAWPWDKEKERPNTELEDLLERPSAYEGQTVSFRCRFALQGRLFKHFNTRFSPEDHTNFAVWEADAPLWDDQARRSVLPTLYVEKRDLAALQMLRQLQRYELVEVRGTVLGTYANLPWILVDEIQPAGTQEDTLTDTAIVHVRRGRELLRTGESALAARHFEMALEQGIPADQHGTILQWLGQAQAEAGLEAKAAETYASAVQLAPDQAEMRLAYARVLLKLEQAEAAAEQARTVMDLTADYPEAHGVLAEAYALQGKYDQAIEEADLGLHVPGLSARDQAMAQVHRARVLTRAGRAGRAVRAYAMAIGEGSPLAAEVWLRKEIGELYEGEYDRTGELAMLEEAEREYANANVLAGSEDAEALYLLARVLYKRSQAVDGTDLPRARELLRQALEIDPDFAPAKELLGRIAMARGEVEEARRLLRDAADSAEDARAFVSLGLNYEKLGQMEEAAAAYAKALELDPTDRQALSHHAELAAARGDLPAALEDYAVLIRLQPEEPVYRLRQGELAIEAGDLRLAETTLKPVVRQGGGYAQDAACLIAQLELKRNRVEKAERVYQAVLEENPTHLHALEGLAKIAFQREDYGLAMETARKALGSHPQDAALLELLGQAEFRAGRPDAAAATLSRIPPDRRSREQWLLLARAALASGREDAATEGLQEALAPIRPGENPHDVQPILREAAELLKAIDHRMDARREQRAREALAETSPEAEPLSEPVRAPEPEAFGGSLPSPESETGGTGPLAVRPLEIPGTVYVQKLPKRTPAAPAMPSYARASERTEAAGAMPVTAAPGRDFGGERETSAAMSVDEMLRRAEALEREQGIDRSVLPAPSTSASAPTAPRQPSGDEQASAGNRSGGSLPFIAEELIPPRQATEPDGEGGVGVMPATWTDAPDLEAENRSAVPGPVRSDDFEIEAAELSALTAVPWADAPPLEERARREIAYRKTRGRTERQGRRAEVLVPVPGVVEIPGPWQDVSPRYAAMVGPAEDDLRRNELRNLDRISRITGLAVPQAGEDGDGPEGPVSRTAEGRTVLMQIPPGRETELGEPELLPDAGSPDPFGAPLASPADSGSAESRYHGENLSDLPEWAR